MNGFLTRGNKLFILYIIISLVVLILLIPGISTNHRINAPENPYLSIWYNEYLLTYNDHKYKVTDETTNEIGQVIGNVVYHGNKPGMFKLYSVKGVDSFTRIAVETKEGYLIAIIEE